MLARWVVSGQTSAVTDIRLAAPADLDTLAGLVEARKLRGVIMAQYGLADVPDAFNASQHGHVGGRDLYGKLGITVQ